MDSATLENNCAFDADAEVFVVVEPMDVDGDFFCVTATCEGFELVIEWVEAKDVEQAKKVAVSLVTNIVKNRAEDDPLPADQSSVDEMTDRLGQVLGVVGDDWKCESSFDGGIEISWTLNDWEVSVTFVPGKPSHIFAMNLEAREKANRIVGMEQDLRGRLSKFQMSLV